MHFRNTLNTSDLIYPLLFHYANSVQTPQKYTYDSAINIDKIFNNNVVLIQILKVNNFIVIYLSIRRIFDSFHIEFSNIFTMFHAIIFYFRKHFCVTRTLNKTSSRIFVIACVCSNATLEHEQWKRNSDT